MTFQDWLNSQKKTAYHTFYIEDMKKCWDAAIADEQARRLALLSRMKEKGTYYTKGIEID